MLAVHILYAGKFLVGFYFLRFQSHNLSSHTTKNTEKQVIALRLECGGRGNGLRRRAQCN